MKTKPLSGELPLWNTRKCHQHQIGKGRNMKIASIANICVMYWMDEIFCKAYLRRGAPRENIEQSSKHNHPVVLKKWPSSKSRLLYESNLQLPLSYPWQALQSQFWENFFSKKKVMCWWELCVSYVEKCGQSEKVVHAKEGEAESNINNKCSLSTTR